MKNKKAQVHFGLLVVTAVVLSLGALYAFATFNNDFQKKSEDLSLLASQIETNENIVKMQAKQISNEAISQCPSCTDGQLKNRFKEIANTRHSQTEQLGNFFGRIRNDQFSFSKQNELYVFSTENLFVKSNQGWNEIFRNFEICMTFDSLGNFVKNCNSE